jgi:parallel beta-helix repeat protein
MMPMNKKTFKATITVFALLLSLASFVQVRDAKAQSKSIVVPTDYPTIQGAINAAIDGDIVIVISGNYNENIVINKSVNVRSDNQAIVDGRGKSSVFNVSASKVSIAGFVIQNASSGVLLANSNNSIIRNNIIRNLTGQDNTAIYTGYDHNSSGCTISDNLLTNNSRGIHIVYSENYTISNNTIQDNDDFGIRLLSSSRCNLSGNFVARNRNLGIQLTSSPNNTVLGNEIEDNGCGIWVEWSIETGNVIVHNSIINNSEQARAYMLMPFSDKTYFSTSIWDMGYPSGGNYWSGYSSRYPHASEIDNSGIWNTPYVIDVNNTDNYPLVNISAVSSPSPSLSPSSLPSPSVAEFPNWIILPLMAAAAIMIICLKKHKRS